MSATPWTGDVEEWLSVYSGTEASAAVLATIRPFEAGEVFSGHDVMLSVQTYLVKLGSEGHGGVPEALAFAEQTWLASPHTPGEDPAQEWRNGLIGAVQKYGGAPRATHSVTRDSREATGWEQQDLRDVVQGLIDGTRTRLRPTVGRTSVGQALFYAARVNGLAGASGDGKSWTALHTCAQELADGNVAFYIDYEDSSDGIVTRLLQLGVEPEAILNRFVYLNPDTSLGDAELARLLALVAERAPTVVIVDSTGEALAAEGINPNADEEVALWFQRVARAIAKLGPAVVVLDHMSKSADGGLWPIGSQRKRAAISGAQYIQEVLGDAGFSEGKAGQARLKCAKDRPGTYFKGQVVANLRIAPTSGHGTGNLRGSVLAELESIVRVPEISNDDRDSLERLAERERQRFAEGLNTARVLEFVKAGNGTSKRRLEEAFVGVSGRSAKSRVAKDGQKALGREKARALIEQAVAEGLVHWTGNGYAEGTALVRGEADE
ncbi:AAA family ATPase [Microbacterium sp. NPDC087868]|uniref:AAA family ATPase n=1 Tax=Microbacterium sp. NPDC087868 TaxID=3364195 RepID=UPI00384E7025